MRNYVLCFNLLLAIPWGFVTAQEEIPCEIIDFFGEIDLDLQPCVGDDVEFEMAFYETSYDSEEDSPPKLREDSLGLLAKQVLNSRSCVTFPHEFTLDENSGILVPIYFEQFENSDMITIKVVDTMNPENKVEISPTLTSGKWYKDSLEEIFLDGHFELPGNKFKLSLSIVTTGNGRVFIEFIQIFNPNRVEAECKPREIPDPEPPTEPPTESTDPPTETTDPPTESTDPPTETTDPPTETTDPPTESTDPSTESTDPPTESTEPPTESTDPPTESTDPPTESTDPPTVPTTESTKPSTETTDPPTEPTESTTTEAPKIPEPESTEPEWKVVAAVFISLFCGACVLILILIFKPFLTKASTASGLVTNETPMSRTNLPRLQVESGSLGISGVNRESDVTWP